MNSCKQLEKEGFEVTYLDVGKEGIVDPKDVAKALRPETVLVSIMYANNEIGTIQPIREIAKVIRNFKKNGDNLGGLNQNFSRFHPSGETRRAPTRLKILLCLALMRLFRIFILTLAKRRAIWI